MTTPTPASTARTLRRHGPGRTDPRPQPVGDRITRHRDQAFVHLPLRPSPALLEQPAPLRRSPPPTLPPDRSPAFCNAGAYFAVRLPLDRGADIYAGGEAAGPLRRTGRTISLWTTDAFGYDDTTPALYQAHPWVLGVRPDGSAFGLLCDTPRRGLISAGKRDLVMAFEGEPFAAYLIERDHPAEVVQALAELTGRPAMPPAWALGYHQCRWSYEPASRVRELAAEFRARRMPCDVLWMDIDYMRGFRVFTFDEAKFPDPAALNADLHEQGFKSVWMIDPGVKVDARDAVYQAGRDGGHFVTDAHGSEFHGDVWPGPCAFPDFTRARTRDWWAGLYRDYMAHGIDGVWNDMNEPAVFHGPGKSMPDTNRHDADPELGGPDSHARCHNIYGMQMVRASREGIQAANPDKRPFVLTRSNFLGGQRYAWTWTGDNTSDWRHLGWSITMALNLGLSGQPFAGPDIGGFAGDADGHLFARWMGIGALLPFARGHSVKGSRDHEPWSFGASCERVCRLALERRYRLLPYLYTLAREATQTGMPIVRPLFFADPADPGLRDADDSFLLGGDILVRARTRFTGPCRAPMPPGGWAPFEPAGDTDRALPELFVREGAVVPLGPAMQHVGEKPLDPLTLVVHPDAQGLATGTLYEDAGEGLGYTRDEYRLTRFDWSAGGRDATAEEHILAGRWSPPARETRIELLGVGRGRR